MHTRLFAGVLLCLAALPAAAQNYHVTQTQSVSANRILQVLEDTRLTQDMVRQMWDVSVDPGIVFGEDNRAARETMSAPLLPDELVLADSHGKVLATFFPEKMSPLARIEDRQLPGAILVTTDDSAGFGSYSGLRTHLLSVSGGRIVPIEAMDGTGKSSPIILSNTLKAEWRITGKGGSERLLQIRCDPDFAHPASGGGDQQFVTSYITFRRTGGVWHRLDRHKPGYWETGDDFPVGLFP